MSESMTLQEAVIAAQSIMDAPRKTAENPHFHSRFAPLDELLNVAKPALNAHGVAVLQPLVTMDDGRIGIRTVLVGHGEQLDLGTLALPGGSDAQKVGSLLTYLRRYALASALGLAAEDDDDGNNAASDEGKAKAAADTAKVDATVAKASAKKPGKATDDPLWPEWDALRHTAKANKQVDACAAALGHALTTVAAFYAYKALHQPARDGIRFIAQTAGSEPVE